MNMNMQTRGSNQEAILEQLQQIDFALYETVLYLDAYPENYEAMVLYRSLLQARETLVDNYQKTAPLTAFGNTRAMTSWDWVKTPWPWEN